MWQQLLVETLSHGDQPDVELLWRAFCYAREKHKGQVRLSGRPFLHHCVTVARLLAQLHLDDAAVAAGLLHDVLEDTSTTHADLAAAFGEQIAGLVDGVTKIERFRFESREARQAETYRKMLLSMVRDIRVILIKLVDRLHNMRTLEFMDGDTQQRIARETLDVYAPLAHRFGLALIRWELEDRSLKFLDPEAYQTIREKVSMTRHQREEYIERFTAPIRALLAENSISAEITGRPKNFYSIYNKMRTRGKPFEELYDLLAVRIIVHSVRDCYHTLGLVHSIYRPLTERFKDYISTPKSNMYQSLHTSVVGPQGRLVEVQIRTWDMHHTAEIGIAAHWRYKSAEPTSEELDRHVAWLRQVLEWQQEATDPAEFMASLKIELFQDEVFVFTPRGDLHQLPRGATPIDFAFAVHTDVGQHCLAARVNGQLVPLNTELKSGDTVQIVTSPNQRPNHSWLELARTTKARQRIRRALKDQQHAQNVAQGQSMLERELKRFRATATDAELAAAASEFGLASVEDLYAALGSGDVSLARLTNRLFPQRPTRRSVARLSDNRGITVQGMGDLMVSFGKCCNPITGDPIVGLVTRGRGLTVHRTDCPNIEELSAHPERLIAVEWDEAHDRSFTVQLRTRSLDRKYLLSDMCKAISDTGTNIRGSSTHTHDDVAEQSFWIDVRDTHQLREILARLRSVAGVLEVRRMDEAAPLPVEPGDDDSRPATA